MASAHRTTTTYSCIVRDVAHDRNDKALVVLIYVQYFSHPGFFHAGNNENNTGNIQTDGNGAHITPLSAISRSKLLEINSKGPGSVKNLVHFFSSKASDTGSVSDASEYTNGTNLRGDNVSLYSYKSASTNSSPRTARDIISNNRSENNMIAKKYRELAKAKMIQDQLTAAENRRIEEVREALVTCHYLPYDT